MRGRKAESVAALGEPGAPRNEGGGASPAAMPAAVAAALTALAALRKTAALSPAEDKGALCSLLLLLLLCWRVGVLVPDLLASPVGAAAATEAA